MSMLKKVYWKLCWIHSINIIQYIYYNFLCKKIIREPNVYIIPYKGAILELQKGSKLFLNGRNLSIGINRIGKSKAETYIRLMKGATWSCDNGAALCYGSTIDVHENARVETGYFFMNTGSVLVASKNIRFGDDVLIGRDNVIYDSDFHPLLGRDGVIRNSPQEVFIGNHVWLTNHVMVQKGVTIEDGAVISPFTILKKDVQSGVLMANGTEQTCVKNNILWSSDKL